MRCFQQRDVCCRSIEFENVKAFFATLCETAHEAEETQEPQKNYINRMNFNFFCKTLPFVKAKPQTQGPCMQEGAAAQQ